MYQTHCRELQETEPDAKKEKKRITPISVRK